MTARDKLPLTQQPSLQLSQQRAARKCARLHPIFYTKLGGHTDCLRTVRTGRHHSRRTKGDMGRADNPPREKRLETLRL